MTRTPPYRSLLLLVVFCPLLYVPAFAQETMSVNIAQRCVFSGGIMDEELYRFEESNRVSEWVEEILKLGGAERNFQLVQTNVENISAVLDGNTRYLFYSVDFIEKATRMQVYAALSHEIGHHVNRHTFKDASRMVEESEADFFMGYVLSKKNFPLKDIESLLQQLPSSYDVPTAKRLKTILEGYGKASRALTVSSIPFDDDPRLDALLLPSFTFQKCFTNYNMPRGAFANAPTLGKVDEKICLVLDQRGYYNRSYFSVKNGFAIMSQMEQYNQSDASIRNDRTRWLPHPARDQFAGVVDYLTSVVMPNKGYFRVFVFVVTTNAFRSSDEKITKHEAAAWLSQGANRLPDSIAKIPFASDCVVSALVYEFEVPESNRNAKQVCPTPYFDAKTHLIKAGLGSGFGF